MQLKCVQKKVNSINLLRSHEVDEDEPDYLPDFKPDPDEWEWDQSNLGTIQVNR